MEALVDDVNVFLQAPYKCLITDLLAVHLLPYIL